MSATNISQSRSARSLSRKYPPKKKLNILVSAAEEVKKAPGLYMYPFHLVTNHRVEFKNT